MELKRIVSVVFIMLLISNLLDFSFAVTSDEKILISYDDDAKEFVYDATVTSATTTTRYRVIGFIAKFKDYNVIVKMNRFADQSAGNGLVTVPFRIPVVGTGNTVMQRFVDKYGNLPDFIDFFSNSNTIYLDAIMTIIEGPGEGVPLADLDYSGTITNHKTGKASDAKEGRDYFTSSSSIMTARSWRVPSDLKKFYGLYCPFPPQDVEPGPTTAHITKNGTIVDNGTLSYMDDDEILLSGEKSVFPPEYPDGSFYKWEYKWESSTSWSEIANGEGKVIPAFPKLSMGRYNVKLTVWYRIGSKVYLNKQSYAVTTLVINQSPQGAYVIAEPASDGDKTVTQSQIDSNAAVNIVVTVKGTLKNYTDTGKITLWKNNLRKDPPGTDDQFQAFTYTSGLGLTQTSQKTFTVRAGVLKNAETYTQKFAVSSYVTVNGQVLQSNIEYCSATLHKGTPPPPPTANKPPVAVISAPSTAKLGNDVLISGTGSYDPDGTVEGYLWGIQGPNLNSKDPYFSVTYSKIGDYSIFLEVTDNKGARGAAQQTITIVAPTPEAHFTVTGTKKEMRVITLTNTSSSPMRYPVSAAQNKWTITPVEGSGATADAVYKVTNKSAAKEKVAGDPYTVTCLNGLNTPMVAFTKAGQYDVTLTITNTAGYSNATTQRITIQPDLPPVSKFRTETKIYRETIVNGVNYAKITVNDESYSPDGDFISYRKIWAVYDANNNGIFNDAGDQTIVISETSDRSVIDTVKAYEYMTREVGRYDVHVTVKESYIP